MLAKNLKMLRKDFEADSILYSFIQNYYHDDEEEYRINKQFIETYIIRKTEKN